MLQLWSQSLKKSFLPRRWPRGPSSKLKKPSVLFPLPTPQLGVFWWFMVKESACTQETLFDAWVGNIHWRRGLLTHSSFLAWIVP